MPCPPGSIYNEIFVVRLSDCSPLWWASLRVLSHAWDTRGHRFGSTALCGLLLPSLHAASPRTFTLTGRDHCVVPHIHIISLLQPKPTCSLSILPKRDKSESPTEGNQVPNHLYVPTLAGRFILPSLCLHFLLGMTGVTTPTS